MVGWTILLVTLAGYSLAGSGGRSNDASPDKAAYGSDNGSRNVAADPSRRDGGEPDLSARDREVSDSLKEGGYVILLRVGPTEPAGQKYELAREIGDTLRELSIPVGEVLSSPDPVALQTSARGFGEDQAKTTDALKLQDASVVQKVDGPNTELRRLLSKIPPSSENTVLVGTVSGAESLEATEVEAVIFKPLGNDSFQRVALLTPSQWTSLAQN